MWARIPYSARIGLPVRQYIGEVAQKPILPPRKNTDGKNPEKNARNATEFLISMDLGKVWPPLMQARRDAEAAGAAKREAHSRRQYRKAKAN